MEEGNHQKTDGSQRKQPFVIRLQSDQKGSCRNSNQQKLS
jgi:hypothetical protein